ncbi:type IV secretion protein Rhs [Trinickia violacea]|uniref:Type IV secretion protein Rhs n=1 Tax=Trinickia violacea TaxID=2571746 RepID=A0A4P8IY69_9BURK|nr:RHS repeat-associated core domain-containing protein [Trinickia violacea]QCP54368.1 type IV secretion protein Rhs [Trinickia violacea]
MGDLWAAREGDALLHTSPWADLVGGVLEVAANIAVQWAATALVAAAIGVEVASLSCGTILAIGLVVAAGLVATGLGDRISGWCQDIGNALFPPTVQAHIATGSKDTRINGKPAARAAGILLTEDQIAALEKAAQDAPPKEQSIIDIAGAWLQWGKEFVSQMVQPTVASPEPAIPCDEDKILCDKHPSPVPKEYLAEGVKRVTINAQPAGRSGARSTCEAKIVDAPANGADVSPDVRIGGPLAVVREIRSGKEPVALAIGIVMAFMGKGNMLSKAGCFLVGLGLNLITQKAGEALRSMWQRASNAVSQPVNAATGAKYLAGDEDRDFSLPGRFPLVWQRVYNSQDTRMEGLFGAGWSVPLEVSVERTPGASDPDRWTYIDETGRRLDMQPVRSGEGFRSPGEGLGVRRSDAGQWLVESDDGVYRVFAPDPRDAGRQRLVLLGDRNRNALRLHYDDDGRIVRIMDNPQTLCVLLHYDERTHRRRVARIERRYGESLRDTVVLAQYRYDAAGDLAEVLDAAGHTLRQFAYDKGRRMVMHRLRAGLVCHYRWGHFVGPTGEEWRVTEHWTDSGDHYWLDHDPVARRLTVSDSLGRTSRHEWNAQYQVTRYEDELGQVSCFEWNDERQLVSMTDAQGGVWRWSYDDAGRLASSTDPLGRVTQTQWHPAWSLPLMELDAAGQPWRYVYDDRGNSVMEIDPLMQRTVIRYDAWGQPVQITDARGGNRVLQWTNDGQLARHTDCSGSQTSFYYDNRGLLECVTDAEGNSSRYRYDALGRLSRVIRADGSEDRFTLDASGQLVARTDALAKSTRYTRDAHGRVVERIDAAGHCVRFEYDAYGRLNALVNANGERYGFGYDVCDRVVEQIGLDGLCQQTDYDALGQTIATRWVVGTMAQMEHRYVRDAVGRLTRRVTSQDVTDYRHDVADNLLEIRRTLPADGERDPEGKAEVISFAYDALGQLLEETTSHGTLLHAYDELGNRTSTMLPDGSTVNLLYYGSGHLHQINVDGQTVSDIERDRLHREVLRSQGRLSTRSLYDARGRVSRRQSYREMRGIVPDSVIDRRYGYDGLSRLVNKHHTLQGQTAFGYDGEGLITECRNDGYYGTWRYDAAANLLDETQRGGERSNVIRFNRVLAMRGRRYSYDAYGRMSHRDTVDGMQRYRYDAHHRLVEARVERTGLPERRYGYEYDALGRRTAKYQIDADGQRHSYVRFLWDGMRLCQEMRLNGSVSVYLYNGVGSYEPLARLDAEGDSSKRNTLYYHTDVNGAPEELTDASGEIVWRTQYQIWGNTVVETAVEEYRPQQNLRYQGQYLDRETGLHYNLFRYYDPDMGRFITPDPIGLAGGLNLYQYAPNPISWIDPWGLETCRLTAKQKRAMGPAPAGMKDPHYHHIVRENAPSNWNATSRQHILDSQSILDKHGIGLNDDARNFTWAQNGGGNHTQAAAEKVFNTLSAADASGGKPAVESALKNMGEQMKQGTF